MNKYFSDCLTCVRGLYFFAKTKIVKYIKEKKKKNDYLAGNLFNNDQEQPARILSSEEIDNMINKQAVYAELHPNVNEYKIVKQGGEEEGEHDKKEEHIEEIKKEIVGGYRVCIGLKTRAPRRLLNLLVMLTSHEQKRKNYE